MQKTIGSVESLTGGLFASTITSWPGASKYFRGALILYVDDLKVKFGINISKGVINKDVARQMALIGKKILNVDICVAFTGNAGPDPSDNKPVGEVWIAINEKVYELHLIGTRTEIRKQCVDFALLKIKFLQKYRNI